MEWLEEFRDGLALICAEDGRILQILRNDAGLVPPGTASFLELFTDDGRVEAEAFFATLKKNQATFGWEIEMKNGAGEGHFAGGITNEGVLIIGARAAANVRFFCREFVKMHNEQTNALRTALKELSLKQRNQGDLDHQLYEELSRLNNELVTIQREVTRKNFELDKLNRMKNHFLGMASHDLRKPVSVVLMYVDLLRGHVTGDGREWLGQISDSCRDVLRQLSDFLDIAQIESGRLKLTQEELDYVPLLAERVEIHGNLARAKEIQYEFTNRVGNARVSGDAGRLRQVLDNLLENAAKYSPKGSRVRVTVEMSGGKVLTEVADEGPGVPSELREQLFAPFRTGSAKTTGGERSTGLGLAIAKAIVEEHGGRIWLESRPNEGARFYFDLNLLPG